MHIELEDIIIRDFVPKDLEDLYRIVREDKISYFMADWKENSQDKNNLLKYIIWLGTQADSTDVFENKRYGVALKATDKLIGMVGMGTEETLGEVEIAYFISEAFQQKGYGCKAVRALTGWCFQVSKLSYLIAAIDCANTSSCRLAQKCGFTLFEKRTPISHKQPNMQSESYYYYRLYRQ